MREGDQSKADGGGGLPGIPGLNGPGPQHGTLDDLVGSLGAYTREAVFVSASDPDDGATLRLVWVNPAFEAMTGWSLEDVAQGTARQLLSPDVDAGIHARIIEALESWTAFETEMKLRRAGDDGFWAQAAFTPVRDADGVNRWWVCQFFDISEFRKTADELRNMSLIAQHTRDMVCVLDRQRRVTWVNRSFVEQSGVAREDAIGLRLSDMLRSPVTDTQQAAELVTLLDGGQPAVAELVSKRRDGSRFLGEYEYQPVRDVSGRLTKFVVMIRDVTAKRTLSTRYKAIFDQTRAAISIVSQGRYVMVNRPYAAVFGKTPEDIKGMRVEDLLDADEYADLKAIYTKVETQRSSQTWERTRRDEFGQTRYFMARTFLERDPVLGLDLICTVGTDITQIRNAEAKLRSSQRAAQAAENRLWAALNAVPDGFVIYDSAGRVAIYNRAFEDMHKQLREELANGISFEALLTQGLNRGVFDTRGQTPSEWLVDQLTNRDTKMREGTLMALSDGRWILCREVVLTNGERAGVRLDVTDAKHREEELNNAQQEAARAQSRLEAAIMVLDDGFAIYDNEDDLVLINTSFEGIHRTGNSDAPKPHTFEQNIRDALTRGQIPVTPEHREEWVAERIQKHRNPQGPFEQELGDGQILRITERKTNFGDTVIQYVDLTQQRRQESRLAEYAEVLRNSQAELKQRNRSLEAVRVELEHASRHDALTGLANRRYLEQQLRKARIEQDAATEAGDTPQPQPDTLSVLHIDLDRFKQINDAFGHDTGDQLLIHAATLLRGCVGPGDFVARVGGDEFVILCRPGRDREGLSTLARNIVAQMRKPVTLNGHECLFGASVGIAQIDTLAPGEDLEDLLINADIALYRAKEAGRSRWVFHSEQLQSEIVAQKALADDLTRAVSNAEFQALYQPQISAQTGELAGIEALLRWRHPERGVLTPQYFVQVAEDLRLQRNIDQMIWAQVRADDLNWQRNGLRVPRISINLSGRRLRDPDLLADIAASGLDPHRLVIEILETVFVDEDDHVRDWNIDRLRDIGCAIELDDFGTGHSSIVGLIKLRPRGIKIDRAFVEQTLWADGNAAVVEAMISMGHALGVEVIAEGVETVEHIEKLVSIGCDILQGFAFSQPLSARDLLMREALPQEQRDGGLARIRRAQAARGANTGAEASGGDS